MNFEIYLCIKFIFNQNIYKRSVLILVYKINPIWLIKWKITNNVSPRSNLFKLPNLICKDLSKGLLLRTELWGFRSKSQTSRSGTPWTHLFKSRGCQFNLTPQRSKIVIKNSDKLNKMLWKKITKNNHSLARFWVWGAAGGRRKNRKALFRRTDRSRGCKRKGPAEFNTRKNVSKILKNWDKVTHKMKKTKFRQIKGKMKFLKMRMTNYLRANWRARQSSRKRCLTFGTFTRKDS